MIRIAINPWPGYEFLYLAEQKGFFREANLNVRIIQYSSLADVQRAFLMNQVDGMGSTLIELVQAIHQTGKDARAVLVADYSDGGDVIIGHEYLNSLEDIRGKRVGLEVNSLGIFMLARALDTLSMKIEDVHIVNVEQMDLAGAFSRKEIDAAITYPPFAPKLLEIEGAHTIFTSSLIPGEVVDVISFDRQVLLDHPHLVQQLHQVWDRTLDYVTDHKQESYEIMAAREQITAAEFARSLDGLRLLSSEEQEYLFKESGPLQQAARLVEDTLHQVGAIDRLRLAEACIYREP